MSVVASFAEALRSEVPVAELGVWPGVTATPEAVVHPTTTEEVATTLRLASAHGVGVLVAASGARLRTSRELDRPFLVLRTDRLSGIDVYEPADLTLTAKAGTPIVALADELRANRQWLPFDPPHADTRSLGGLVATGASGPLWMGYGELRNHVLGLTVVTGDGRTLRLGGRVVKNVAGFDLLKPLVGSRGRLGVITSVCVRAFPVPVCERVLVLRADAPEPLLPVARAVGTAPLLPVSCVLAGGTADGARLLVRLHGAEPTVEADRKALERHCAVQFESASDPAGVVAQARDHAAGGPLVLAASVLPSRLPEAFAALSELTGERTFAADTYAATIRVSAGADSAPRVDRVRARIEALGGTLSVRADDRTLDLDSLGSSVTPAAAALAKNLERVFDPEGVLWPNRP